jgi:hypothetical protein
MIEEFGGKWSGRRGWFVLRGRVRKLEGFPLFEGEERAV